MKEVVNMWNPIAALVGVLIVYWCYLVTRYLKDIRDELRKMNSQPTNKTVTNGGRYTP